MSSRPVWHRLAATVGFAILPAYAQSASNVQRAGGHAPADLNAPQALPPLKAQENANYDVAVDALSTLTESQIRALRRRLDRAKRAAAASPQIPTKRVNYMHPVDVSPGSSARIGRLNEIGAEVTIIDRTRTP